MDSELAYNSLWYVAGRPVAYQYLYHSLEWDRRQDTFLHSGYRPVQFSADRWYVIGTNAASGNGRTNGARRGRNDPMRGLIPDRALIHGALRENIAILIEDARIAGVVPADA